MSSKNSPKLRLPFLYSLIIHMVFIAISAIGALTYVSSSSENSGNSMNAVMVDRKIMSEQNQRQLSQQDAVEKHEMQRRKQALEKEKLLKEQKIAQQRKLKEIEKQRLAALSRQQAEMAAAEEKRRAQEKEKAILDEQYKKALFEKQQAELEKQKAIEAIEHAKKVQKEMAKAKIESEKEQVLDDILGDLISNEPKVKPVAKGSDIEKYTSLVHSAITSKFINPKLYRGKNCIIKMTIAPDGLLIDVSAVEGDELLCREAISATKNAIIPKPANDSIYQEVKNFVIDFRPE